MHNQEIHMPRSHWKKTQHEMLSKTVCPPLKSQQRYRVFSNEYYLNESQDTELNF